MNSLAGVRTAGLVWLATGPAVCASTTVSGDGGFAWKSFAVGFGVAGVLSYIPDLDHEGSTAGRAVGKGVSNGLRKVAGGHRMGLHSLTLVVLAFWVTLWLTDTHMAVLWQFAPPFDYFSLASWEFAIGAAMTSAHPLAYAAAVGLLSHIWCDLMTVQGVALLWPFRRRKFRIASLRTGGAGEERYVLLVNVALIVVALWHVHRVLASTGLV